MPLKILSHECCYGCVACVVTKRSCTRKNKVIPNIYERQQCDQYEQMKLSYCTICHYWVRELAQHVRQKHGLTLSQYNVVSSNTAQSKPSEFNRGGGSVWDCVNTQRLPKLKE